MSAEEQGAPLRVNGNYGKWQGWGQKDVCRTNGVASAVGADLDSWTEYNTTVSTTDGKVSNILRIWVP